MDEKKSYSFADFCQFDTDSIIMLKKTSKYYRGDLNNDASKPEGPIWLTPDENAAKIYGYVQRYVNDQPLYILNMQNIKVWNCINNAFVPAFIDFNKDQRNNINELFFNTAYPKKDRTIYRHSEWDSDQLVVDMFMWLKDIPEFKMLFKLNNQQIQVSGFGSAEMLYGEQSTGVHHAEILLFDSNDVQLDNVQPNYNYTDQEKMEFKRKLMQRQQAQSRNISRQKIRSNKEKHHTQKKLNFSDDDDDENNNTKRSLFF